MTVCLDHACASIGAGQGAAALLCCSAVVTGLLPVLSSQCNSRVNRGLAVQGLSESAGSPVRVSFTPTLMPMSRGMQSTIYVKLANGASVDDLRGHLQVRHRPTLRSLTLIILLKCDWQHFARRWCILVDGDADMSDFLCMQLIIGLCYSLFKCPNHSLSKAGSYWTAACDSELIGACKGETLLLLYGARSDPWCSAAATVQGRDLCARDGQGRHSPHAPCQGIQLQPHLCLP